MSGALFSPEWILQLLILFCPSTFTCSMITHTLICPLSRALIYFLTSRKKRGFYVSVKSHGQTATNTVYGSYAACVSKHNTVSLHSSLSPHGKLFYKKTRINAAWRHWEGCVASLRHSRCSLLSSSFSLLVSLIHLPSTQRSGGASQMHLA